ncbi:MAG: hypothetical protein AAF668_15050 [Pseudomonadota bacterium]
MQLGEADNLLRIAFVCSSDCTIERSVNQSYFLRGVTADIELDVSRRSRHLNRLALSVDGDDSRISFDVSSEFESPIARPCALEGVDAVCLDFKRGDAALAAADLTDQDDDAPEDDNQTALAQPAAPSNDSDASVTADLSPDDTSEPTLAQQGVAPPTQASLEADLPLRQSAAPGFGYDYDFRFDFYPARPRPMDPPPLLIRARQIDQPALQREVQLRDDATPLLGVAVFPEKKLSEAIRFLTPDPPALTPARLSASPAIIEEDVEEISSDEGNEGLDPVRAPEALVQVKPPSVSNTSVSSKSASTAVAASMPVSASAQLTDPFDDADAQGIVDVALEVEKILGRSVNEPECTQALTRLKDDAWALDAMVDLGFCQAAAGDLSSADKGFARLLAYTPDNYEALVGRALIAATLGDRTAALNLFQDALNVLPPIEESNRIVEAMARL